jgi:GlpG protein
LRQIGTVPKSLNAKAFADYLLSLGMKTRVDDHPEGSNVWIYNEDHFQQARDELQDYLRQPDDPRYRSAAETAESIRRKEKELEKKFRKNFRDSSDVWGYPSFRQRPLTTLLITACVVVFIMEFVESCQPWIDKLHFSSYTEDARGNVRDFGLGDIEHGEVWRLVTPALMHSTHNPLHIVFNLLWLRLLGTLIEVRRGTLRLAALILVAAAVSNYGQYEWMVRRGDVGPFLGMSGVVYALFGYVWMKGLYQPEQRMAVHPNNVNIMIVWLFLCMTGMLGPIANGAHVVGLVVGIVTGLAGF